MKKTFLSRLVAFSLVLLLILASAVPAFAAKEVSVKVEIAGADGTLYVRLTAPKGSEISTFSASLLYDDEKLEFSNVSFIENPSVVNSENSFNDGTVVASTVIAETLTEESKIFTYVFKILDGAEGECEFSFENVKATDKDNKELSIVLSGPLTAVISELEPLTPDVIQSSFEPTTAPESTEPEPTEPDKANAADPNVPNTANGTRTVLVIGFLMLSLLICGIALKKKKSET